MFKLEGDIMKKIILSIIVFGFTLASTGIYAELTTNNTDNRTMSKNYLLQNYYMNKELQRHVQSLNCMQECHNVCDEGAEGDPEACDDCLQNCASQNK